MPTCAGSDRGDTIWVEVIFAGVGSQESDGAFDVFDHVWEFPLRIQTIIDRCHKIAFGCHSIDEHERFGLVAVHPAAAVNIRQNRPGTTRIWEVKIQFLKRRARRAIGKVSYCFAIQCKRNCTWRSSWYLRSSRLWGCGGRVLSKRTSYCGYYESNRQNKFSHFSKGLNQGSPCNSK